MPTVAQVVRHLPPGAAPQPLKEPVHPSMERPAESPYQEQAVKASRISYAAICRGSMKGQKGTAMGPKEASPAAEGQVEVVDEKSEMKTMTLPHSMMARDLKKQPAGPVAREAAVKEPAVVMKLPGNGPEAAHLQQGESVLGGDSDENARENATQMLQERLGDEESQDGAGGDGPQGGPLGEGQAVNKDVLTPGQSQEGDGERVTPAASGSLASTWNARPKEVAHPLQSDAWDRGSGVASAGFGELRLYPWGRGRMLASASARRKLNEKSSVGGVSPEGSRVRAAVGVPSNPADMIERCDKVTPSGGGPQGVFDDVKPGGFKPPDVIEGLGPMGPGVTEAGNAHKDVMARNIPADGCGNEEAPSHGIPVPLSSGSAEGATKPDRELGSQLASTAEPLVGPGSTQRVASTSIGEIEDSSMSGSANQSVVDVLNGQASVAGQHVPAGPISRDLSTAVPSNPGKVVAPVMSPASARGPDHPAGRSRRQPGISYSSMVQNGPQPMSTSQPPTGGAVQTRAAGLAIEERRQPASAQAPKASNQMPPVNLTGDQAVRSVPLGLADCSPVVSTADPAPPMAEVHGEVHLPQDDKVKSPSLGMTAGDYPGPVNTVLAVSALLPEVTERSSWVGAEAPPADLIPDAPAQLVGNGALPAALPEIAVAKGLAEEVGAAEQDPFSGFGSPLGTSVVPSQAAAHDLALSATEVVESKSNVELSMQR